MKRATFAMLLGALGLASWPLWIWFASGTVDGSNDSAGLLAAAAAIAIVLRPLPTAAPGLPRRSPLRYPLLLPIICMMLYLAATLAGVALSARALLVALALASLASAYRMDKYIDVALLGLCMLALPLAATLQFYAGYPLRVLAGELAVMLLKLNGMAVMRDGAMLAWSGKLVAIDAPCSGLKMLWAALFLACALSAALHLSAARTLVAVTLAALVVIVANAVRASALFYSEAGIVQLPTWSHSALGMVCFGGAALAILFAVRAIRGEAA